MDLGFVAGHGCVLLGRRDRKGRARKGTFTASTLEMSGRRKTAQLRHDQVGLFHHCDFPRRASFDQAHSVGLYADLPWAAFLPTTRSLIVTWTCAPSGSLRMLSCRWPLSEKCSAADTGCMFSALKLPPEKTGEIA